MCTEVLAQPHRRSSRGRTEQAVCLQARRLRGGSLRQAACVDVGCANTQGRKRGGRMRQTQVPGPLRVGARPSARRVLPHSDHAPGTRTPAGSPGTARPRAPRGLRGPCWAGEGAFGGRSQVLRLVPPCPAAASRAGWSHAGQCSGEGGFVSEAEALQPVPAFPLRAP